MQQALENGIIDECFIVLMLDKQLEAIVYLCRKTIFLIHLLLLPLPLPGLPPCSRLS